MANKSVDNTIPDDSSERLMSFLIAPEGELLSNLQEASHRDSTKVKIYEWDSISLARDSLNLPPQINQQSVETFLDDLSKLEENTHFAIICAAGVIRSPALRKYIKEHNNVYPNARILSLSNADINNVTNMLGSMRNLGIDLSEQDKVKLVVMLNYNNGNEPILMVKNILTKWLSMKSNPQLSLEDPEIAKLTEKDIERIINWDLTPLNINQIICVVSPNK